MNYLWGFASIYLCSLVPYIWGQFNPTPLSERPRPTANGILPRSFTPAAVQEAFTRAAQIIEGRRSSFTGRRRTPADRMRDIPVSRHQRFQASRPISRRLESVQEIFEEASGILTNELNLTPEQIESALNDTSLRNVVQGGLIPNCEAQFNVTNCRPNDRYRTFDGSCNNLRHPSWGRAATCFERLVTPDYADENAAKRVAMSGNELPSPRRLSLEVHSHFDNPTDYVNHMFMMWGQFLDHDISLTPLSLGPNQEQLVCCPESATPLFNCDPIIVQSDDPFYSTLDEPIECLDNARSAMCSTCSVVGYRQQTNQVTAYIDGSHIYNLNTEEAQQLRNTDNTGTLRFVLVPEAGELLPTSFEPQEDFCSFQEDTLDCFQTGDQRGNQHPALTSMHTIFLREHNRIARRLRQLNPRWDGDRLYQEARRIVGAEMQIVTYREYLPLVIGPERMQWFDLSVLRGNEFTQYDETVQASLANEFSTAAFRFGHSTINSFFADTRGGRNRGDYLRNMFQYPYGIYSGQIDGIIGGLLQAPSQKFDRHIVRDVTNHLYQNRGNQSGLDLASLNINRGRDHGIPGYTTLVEFCGGPRITTWRDLDRLYQRGMRQLLERYYERVEDIDLFTGGLAERPNQGAVVGPTFTCIIGIQFYHLKYGDRFYFEHGGQAGSFTPAQLREIKKVTLGKIICENTGIDEVPDNSLLYQSNRNPLRRCEDIPEIDLNVWRE